MALGLHSNSVQWFNTGRLASESFGTHWTTFLLFAGERCEVAQTNHSLALRACIVDTTSYQLFGVNMATKNLARLV